ncbi:MAG: ankyrin repeat domain-containing protein [Cognatishimia sp.]
MTQFTPQSTPALQLDALRRHAKQLKRDFEAGVPAAHMRLNVHPPRSKAAAGVALQHADFLHVIAREQNFASWPALKLAADTIGLDRAARVQRLKIAVAQGQLQVIAHLLAETPDLAAGLLGLEIALYDKAAVQAALWEDPQAAVRQLGPKSPILHLCYSRWIHARPDLVQDMLDIAELLRAQGADVNDSMPVSPESDHQLSALYGAIGHADNMPLAAWLLQHGADPNDGESLYHATELGHRRGLKLLLDHGAKPAGTNALLRALDFGDLAAVQMLIAAGADVNEFHAAPVGGELPMVIPALHQAARRMCDAPIVDALLAAGADPSLKYQGVTAYAYARVFGNNALVQAIETRRAEGVLGDAEGSKPLTAEETLLALAAQGDTADGAFVNLDKLPDAYRNIIGEILHLPGKTDHVRRLAALGVEYDRPNGEGLTPVQLAGWEGLPDMLALILRLGPDLSHVNNYGGTLLSTIIHGSENCPQRADRDHIACLELVLHHGVALPQRDIASAGDTGVAAFLSDWAARYPGQVV